MLPCYSRRESLFVSHYRMGFSLSGERRTTWHITHRISIGGGPRVCKEIRTRPPNIRVAAFCCVLFRLFFCCFVFMMIELNLNPASQKHFLPRMCTCVCVIHKYASKRPHFSCFFVFLFDTNPTTLANQTDFSARAVAGGKLCNILYIVYARGTTAHIHSPYL